jgi:hypothetical protein
MQPKTKRYKARDYGKGKFIALPPGASKYDEYDCYINPVTDSIVYVGVKQSIILDQDKRIIEADLYE